MPTSADAPLDALAPLSRRADLPLADQLADRLADPIRQRLAAPGSRLPSVRECARRHGVSASTVVAAYDRLLAQGLVEARKQRGFYVRDLHRPSAVAIGAAVDDRREPRGARDTRTTAAGAGATSPPVATLTAATLMRGMMQPPGRHPMPGQGTLPVEWLNLPMLGSALRHVSGGAQLGPLSLQYGEPAGDQRLRDVLCTRLAELGVAARREQIVTTLGATHALDIVTRTLLRAGDAVLVDEPGWSVEYARLQALGLRMLPVPRRADGPDLDVMQRLIEAQAPEHKPRLYVTVSVLHNPTGACLSLQAAHRVLQLAQQHDFHVLEDDSYAYLAPAHLPRMAALDALQRSIYVSGFSKILAPNWRVGYIAAPPALAERFVDTKLLTTLSTPALTEQALAHCLERGLLRRHADRVIEQLDAARGRAVRLAEAHGCRFAAPPRGLFGWVDTGIDTERLARHMLAERWLVAPGSLFHATPRPTTLMRINFASTQELRFWRAFDAARSALN